MQQKSHAWGPTRELSQKQIQSLCAEIRAGWSDEDFRVRMGLPTNYFEVEIPGYRPSMGVGGEITWLPQ